MELCQNLISGFGEEGFLRISSSLYSAKSTYSPEPCLLTDQISGTVFEKGHPRNISVKLFQNLTSQKPPFTRAMFMDGSKFREQF